tara:strand:+ start:3351 stop:3677 length:327 start_codon:yes stop_codon:yes gene_type:complete
MKITKQRLKEIIKEELNEATEEEIRADLERPAGEARPDEAGQIRQDLMDMLDKITDLGEKVRVLSMEDGNFVVVNTYVTRAHGSLMQFYDKLERAMIDRERFSDLRRD